MIDNEERAKALRSLESISEEKELWKFLHHPDGFIRLCALESLDTIASEVSINIVAMLLNDNFDPVIEAAANALKNIGGDECIQILHLALKSSQSERPNFVSNALAQMGSNGYKALCECVYSKNPNIRYYAARGLGSSGNEDAKAILEKIVVNDHEKTTFGGMVSTAAKKGLKTLSRGYSNG